MEKARSHRFIHLWPHDQNSVHPEETYCQNRVSQEEREITWTEIKITEKFTRSPEETTFNWVRKNDSRLWVNPRAKIEANRKHERRNIKLWINDPLIQDWTGKTPERTSVIQNEILHSKEKITTSKRR